MKVAVVGIGSIGGHVAVRLADAGADVTAIARGATLDAIRREGLRLDAGDDSHRVSVRAAASGDDAGPQDVVFVTVKATALKSIVDTLRPLVHADTRVVFAQNGMTWWYPVALPATHRSVPALPQFALMDAFLSFLAPAQIVPCVVYSANEVVAPGHVRNNSPHRNVLEIASLTDPEDPALLALRACLIVAGIGSPEVTDIRAALWLKLIGNASSSPLSVATGNPSSIVDNPAIRATFERMVAEVLATALAYGFDLAPRFNLAGWTRNRSSHRPSMLQDFEHGRAMEIDEIVLAPGRFARHAGLDTPTLDAIGSVVAELAKGRGLHGPRDEAQPA